MLGCVPGGRDRMNAQATEIELVAIGQAAVRKRQVGAGWAHDCGTQTCELTTAGDEVRVQMRLEAEAEGQSALEGPATERRDVARGVDDRGPPVAEVDRVRGIAQTRIRERGDIEHAPSARRKEPIKRL